MPKREDEYWAGEKGNLKYCSKHQRYYDAKVGCQLCFLEEQNLKRGTDEIPQLQKCPECNQKSLFWNKGFGLYECLNQDCRKKFAQDELTKEKIDNQEASKNESEDELRERGKGGLCPFCGSSSIYEVVKDSWRCRKCEKTFPSPSYGPPGGRSMYYPAPREGETRTQEPPTSGKAWFGNEYFDPEDGKWKKTEIRTFPFKKAIIAFMILILIAGASILAYVALSSSGGIRAPSGFTAKAGNMQITLSWNKKNNADQFLVRCKTTSYPTSVTDGTLLYQGNVTSYVHTNLEYGKTYYYGVWSERIVNGQWEYSDNGAFISGTPYWRGPDGETVQEYVEINGARLVGADGNDIVLFNNPETHNPTWQELQQFLWQDKTDQHLYNLNSFVCADFAEMLHNNAEKAGIRAAYVDVELSGYSDPYNLGIPSNTSHALNAFNTTDKGLLYIDDTGTQTGDINADKTVNLVKGSAYIPISIFPNPGYESQWGSMGTVTDIWVQW